MRLASLLAIVFVGCSSSGADPVSNGDAAPADGDLAWDVGDFDVSAFPDTGFVSPPSRLDLGPTVISDPPPPPISGGTLIVARDGHTAIAADPDRDVVWFVDLDTHAIAQTALKPGDEPGRVVEDGSGHVFVALRRGGAVAKIDRTTHEVLARDPVCPAPRGLAFDDTSQTLYVACAGGELVTVSATANFQRVLAPDLRDIVLSGGQLYVTRFRSGEVMRVSPSSGPVISTEHVPAVEGVKAETVAWRALPSPGGGVLLLHQRARSGPVTISSPGGYGSSSCAGPVSFAVSNIGGALGNMSGPFLPGAFHAVDVALANDGKSAVVVAPGGSHVKGGRQIYRVDLGTKFTSLCGGPDSAVTFGRIGGEPTAVAFAPDGRLVVQSRQPAMLFVDGEPIALPGKDRIDTGHMIFHAGSGFGIACVSCHVEGGEDGITWEFDGIGKRRTQSLRGRVLSSPPFHWDGSLSTFHALVDEVFVRRMLGPSLAPDQLAALARWVDAIPNLPKSQLDPFQTSQGRLVFERAHCNDCHAGPRFTNGTLADVGTGGKFKVPSLVGVGMRAPYLHDGCAKTLRDRFDRCGGGDAHGTTSILEATEIDNLIAYLGSL